MHLGLEGRGGQNRPTMGSSPGGLRRDKGSIKGAGLTFKSHTCRPMADVGTIGRLKVCFNTFKMPRF